MDDFRPSHLLQVSLLESGELSGKHKGAGISISQDVNLYFKNDDIQAILITQHIKVFLKQNSDQIDRLVKDNKLKQMLSW